MTRGRTDRFTLGEVLTRMRAVSEEDVEEALAIQRTQENGSRLGIGEVLVARERISGEQLEAALVAQRDLRSGDPHVRALAAARLASVSGRRVVQVARSCRTAARAGRLALDEA